MVTKIGKFGEIGPITMSETDLNQGKTGVPRGIITGAITVVAQT